MILERVKPTLLLVVFIEASQGLGNSGRHSAQGLSEMSPANALGLHVFLQRQQGSLSADGYDLVGREDHQRWVWERCVSNTHPGQLLQVHGYTYLHEPFYFIPKPR